MGRKIIETCDFCSREYSSPEMSTSLKYHVNLPQLSLDCCYECGVSVQKQLIDHFEGKIPESCKSGHEGAKRMLSELRKK